MPKVFDLMLQVCVTSKWSDRKTLLASIERNHANAAFLGHELLLTINRYVTSSVTDEAVEKNRMALAQLVNSIASPSLADESVPLFIVIAHHPLIGTLSIFLQ